MKTILRLLSITTLLASPAGVSLLRGMDHFEWTVPSASQIAGVPFPASIRVVNDSGQTVTNYAGAVTLGAFTNQVSVLFAEDFEGGDTQGWSWAPEQYAVALTNVPGCEGEACLSISGVVPSGWNVSYGLNDVPIPGQVSFRIRANSTNVDGGELSFDVGETIRFKMRADGTMGLDDGFTDWSPRQPYEALRWYKITLVFTLEPFAGWVYIGYGDWTWWAYTLLWVDFYVDDQLVAAHLDGGIPHSGGHSPHPPDDVDLHRFSSGQTWYDDIKFLSAPEAVAVPLQTSGQVVFTNGLWSGSITVAQPAQELYLTANDGLQHAGTNALAVVVLPRPTLQISRGSQSTNGFTLRWSEGPGLYQLQRASSPSGGPWEDVGTATTNTVVSVPFGASNTFFRLQCFTNAP